MPKVNFSKLAHNLCFRRVWRTCQIWWRFSSQFWLTIEMSVGIMTQVWHYDTGVVLDGNSLRWQITVQALRMKEKEIYAGSLWPRHIYARVRRPKGAYMYTCTFTQEKARTSWKTWFCSVVFGPWYFDPLSWSKVLVLSGFGPWYWVRPKTIKEEGDH